MHGRITALRESLFLKRDPHALVVIDPNPSVRDVVREQKGPGADREQSVVLFACALANLREPPPRNGGKIVVLDVIAHIEADAIEDAVVRVGPMSTAVPFTLYDPGLMAAWAEQVWAEAGAQGSASSLAATWTADTVLAAHEITYDARCVMPQTIPFASDNDDLFKDSDAP